MNTIKKIKQIQQATYLLLLLAYIISISKITNRNKISNTDNAISTSVLGPYGGWLVGSTTDSETNNFLGWKLYLLNSQLWVLQKYISVIIRASIMREQTDIILELTKLQVLEKKLDTFIISSLVSGIITTATFATSQILTCFCS